MVRRWSRFLGSVYLLLAALNVARHGILSVAWAAWALLAAGAFSLAYTPVEKDGKTRYELVFSRQNKLSAALTILGGGLLIFVIFFRR